MTRTIAMTEKELHRKTILEKAEELRITQVTRLYSSPTRAVGERCDAVIISFQPEIDVRSGFAVAPRCPRHALRQGKFHQ